MAARFMFCESTVLKRLKNFFSFSTMATPFETCDTILTQGQADHINERHVSITEHPRTSKFWLTFNLSSTLADLSARTWEEDEDVTLLESGFKNGHGFITYSYSPSMKRLVGILKVFLPNTLLFTTPKNVRVTSGKSFLLIPSRTHIVTTF